MKIIKKSLVLFLKGMAMGAADIVPGVSGGTMAIITNIYQELIASIHGIDVTKIKALFLGDRKKAWKELNGSFLLTLFIGILTSVLVLGSSLKFLLEEYPIQLWAFFFGLVFVSAFFVGKQIMKWRLAQFIGVLIGIIVAFSITQLNASQSETSLLYLFFCGSIAVIAMILPGISGAFILVLLGVYPTALKAIDQLKSFESEGFVIFIVMAIGGLIGLKLFSGILNWLFNKYKDATTAVLVGFMLGSLYKIWPWKKVLASYTNSDGEQVPLKELAVTPQHYEGNSHWESALLLAVLAIIFVIILEKIAKLKISNE